MVVGVGNKLLFDVWLYFNFDFVEQILRTLRKFTA